MISKWNDNNYSSISKTNTDLLKQLRSSNNILNRTKITILLVITINDLIPIKSIINNLNIDHKLISYLLTVIKH